MSFERLRKAALCVDELAELGRRNIQKSIARDAFAVALRMGGKTFPVHERKIKLLLSPLTWGRRGAHES